MFLFDVLVELKSSTKKTVLVKTSITQVYFTTPFINVVIKWAELVTLEQTVSRHGETTAL